jgi:hypothetical protein
MYVQINVRTVSSDSVSAITSSLKDLVKFSPPIYTFIYMYMNVCDL